MDAQRARLTRLRSPRKAIRQVKNESVRQTRMVFGLSRNIAELTSRYANTSAFISTSAFLASDSVCRCKLLRDSAPRPLSILQFMELIYGTKQPSRLFSGPRLAFFLYCSRFRFYTLVVIYTLYWSYLSSRRRLAESTPGGEDSYYYVFNRALAYEKMASLDKALEGYTEALAIRPDHLGMVCLRAAGSGRVLALRDRFRWCTRA